jgi:NAD(P)H-dependent FMN reductase
MSQMRAVVLIGSPKKGGSTSRSLAEHLAIGLRKGDVDVRTYHVQESMTDPSKLREVIDACHDVDLILVSVPLYVDSLPSEVVNWMETMGRKGTEIKKGARFLAMIQCGHPDVDQTSVAVDILRNFSDQMGYEWVGALRMPMGPIIDGRSLSEARGAARHAVNALNLIAEALANGKQMPVEAFLEMQTRPVPVFLYLMMANRMWKRRAKEHGMRYHLMDRPYQV